MGSRIIDRLLAGVVGLAALSLVVPSLALGGVVLDDGAAAHATPAYLASHDVFARHGASTVNQVRPDNRAGALGATPVTTSSRTGAESLPGSSSAGSVLRWRDAAIGAATVLVIFTIALVAVTLQRQHRRSVIAH
jgi:hypothetical protein